MLFTSKAIAAIAALSTLVVAAPQPDTADSLVNKRWNCPCWDEGNKCAQGIAGLYLGAGNNKSRQVERLIEELVGWKEQGCKKEDLYLDCDEDGEHCGWGEPTKAWNNPKHNEGQCDKGWKDWCENEHPYKHCRVQCRGKPECK